MRVLEYAGLDTSRVTAQYAKVAAALARGDFRSAQVKKLTGIAHDRYYRARLDDANRLLFTLVRCGDELAVLALEVILNHDYDRSRFLRGAHIDEAKIPDIEADAAARDAQPLRYLHRERCVVHLLDKPISFDDAQQEVYRQRAPLIVVGSAGSGKTALTLEKLKQAEGDVLYVTHSSYLAQCARELYFAHGYERSGQDASFLSLREFLETLRVPDGIEADWRQFAAWFRRMRQAFRELDAHQVFEEFRGVLTADAQGVLDREAYRALGVRQSIFAPAQRDAVYDLFGKYRAWLATDGLYDLNLVAHERLPLAAPRYDFVVVDEVQDLTAVQLSLVLATLRRPGQFLLCGDSNQIVHPNFFSWSRVKTLFWRDATLAAQQETRVLAANFRNAGEVTRIANTLLKIKHRRFGSIDRESNFLVEAIGTEPGRAVLLADQRTATQALDAQTRRSTAVAVLVMRDEDKAAARASFATPLLFSVHEAKGLEYENIILYRFVSDHRAEFAEIVDGVAAADLADDTLAYRRARDKSDKSLEIYKFFVNALYVALTRAVSNVFLVESDLAHPLFGLLGIGTREAAAVETRVATRDDWQREAQKLEAQGKLEQAEAIRRDFLAQATPPWPVFNEARVRELLVKVFRERAPGDKQRRQLLDYATVVDAPALADALEHELRFGTRDEFEQQRGAALQRSLAAYGAKNFKDVLRECERFGIEHRTPMNLTPLIAAAAAGNLALVEALLERGADVNAVDDYGQNALHWAMRQAFERPEFARGNFAALYERLAPPMIDVQTGQRLVRIDRHLAEYALMQTLWVLFRSRFTRLTRRVNSAFDSAAVLEAWQHLPANVVRAERNKRSHVSSLFSRNEIARDYAWNRALFRRTAHGWYQFDPALSVRVRHGGEERWVPLLRRLNLPLINEITHFYQWTDARQLAADAGLEPLAVPIANEQRYARELALIRANEERLAARAARAATPAVPRAQMPSAAIAAATAIPAPAPAPPPTAAPPPATPAAATAPSAPTAAMREPPWGTRAARQLALQRWADRNAARRQGDEPSEERSKPPRVATKDEGAGD